MGGQRALVGPGALDAPAAGRVLPVASGLSQLLPEGGIRRGATVGVAGSTSLALALGARAAEGAWAAAVGARALGLLAVAEWGYDLERFVVVAPSDPLPWVRAVSALLEPCEVVLAWPPRALSLKSAEQLSARVRERRAALIVVGTGWPGRVDLTLTATRAEWIGVERGAGRFRARLIEVEVTGRGAASLARRATLWLPGPDGTVERIGDDVARRPARAQAAR